MDEVPQLKELLEVLGDYTPTIPDALVEFHLQQVGFTPSDPRCIRLISLAAHKFMLDVAHDALQYQRIRSQTSAAGGAAASSSSAAAMSGSTPGGSTLTGGGTGGGAVKTVLSIEDLSASLKEYGVNLAKPEYYSDVAMEP